MRRFFSMADPYQQASQQDLYEPFNQAKTFTPRFQDIFKQQQGDITDYLSRYRGAIAGQENLPHMYDRIGRELNLPNLTTNANTLTNTLNNLPQTLGEAGRGMPVSSNQLSRLITDRAGKLAPAVASSQSALQNAQGQLNTRTGFEQTQQAKELQPFQTEQQMLTDRFARETTGYTMGMQSELTAIMDKMAKGLTLTEGERARANSLAIAKLDYDAKKYAADKSFEATKYTADKNPFGL